MSSSEVSATVAGSKLWKRTLAERETDPFAGQRGRLRNAFVVFRERASLLATEIRRDIPDLTVHDLTHLDALWEIASLLTGDDFPFSPTEGFVLGGAFLLHDLAMSLAAVPRGYAGLKDNPRWRDLVACEYRQTLSRDPSPQELLEPEASILKKVVFNILRLTHAENAEKLAFASYPASDGTPLFLLEDTELRQTFGTQIGRIAHSHWWSVSQLENSFPRIIGAPHWCPPDWTVDPLKLACVLRVADAAHLDARRAPTFLKALTELSRTSEPHWRFQEKLNKPYLKVDALVFTSGATFKLSESEAWWLCLENMRMVDRELRGVDALLADRGLTRLAARRVAGVDLPERFSSYVQTEAWHPINATVHVTDLPSIIDSLGGAALYGRNPSVALRELIQNGCDAVRARRLHEDRETTFGHIIVSLSEVGGYHWLEVCDVGVGMSRRVLTEFLLDFGRSFWGSTVMHEEFPGLLASGLVATGKFGIGFFSVFMIADMVEVISRRADAAASDTLVLEFSSGLRGRPILRPATKAEQLIDGGTRVRVRLKRNPTEEGGLLYQGPDCPPLTLNSLCSELCPAIDVDLYVREGARRAKVVDAQDWKNIDGSKLLSRVRSMLYNGDVAGGEQYLEELRKRAGANLRPLVDDQGTTWGRACITVGYAGHFPDRIDLGGVVTIGGLHACGLTGICGVLVGQPLRASRDAAMPGVPSDVLAKWAEEQAALVPALWPTPEEQAACAQYVRLCGGNTRDLPIAIHRGQWVTAAAVAREAASMSDVVIMDHFTLKYELAKLEALQLDDNVFVTSASGLPGLLQSRGDVRWPRDVATGFAWGGGPSDLTLGGAVLEAVAQAWLTAAEELREAHGARREDDVRVGVDGTREIRVRATRVVKSPLKTK